MKKIWLVAWATYRPRLRTGSFLFLTFALPVLMVFAGIFASSRTRGDSNLPTVGYVDQTGQLAEINQVETADGVLNLVRFSDPQQARLAVDAGQIQGYLLVPSGYFSGERVQYVGQEAPGATLNGALEQFMRRALLPDAPQEVLTRLSDPVHITLVSLQSGEEIPAEPGLIIRILVPVVIAILFGLAVMFTSSQMGASVVREKSQRAMEMVITAISPSQLVSGKVLGMSLLALTQFGIWILGGFIALLLAYSSSIKMPEPATLLGAIPWNAVVWGVLLTVPGYLLFAMIGAGLGVIAGDAQQAQQLAGLFGLFGLAPIWFTNSLISAPNSPVAVAMTLFPLTGPAVLLIRMAFTIVPLWQAGLCLAFVLLSLGLTIWAVARIFRAAMLVYGQTMQPRQVWQALRQA